MKAQKRKRNVGIKSMTEIEHIIKTFDLQPHPEGGFFKEMYRSSGSIPQTNLGTQFSGDRNYATAIYFLLTSDTFSAFHRIKQDEIWHFYKGAPIRLHVISEDGIHKKISIGNNIEKGEVPQFVVSAHDWFAAEVVEPNSYAFVGCTVSPGFDFNDFELPSRAELSSRFPQHTEIIQQLTRVD